MKKMIICGLVFLSALVFNEAKAQVRVNVNFNVGSQPVWGPVGYDYVEYYYLPDIEAYYYVPSHQYVYLSGSRWVFSSTLPYRYRNYDVYHSYKVVVNEPRAYTHFSAHRAQYASYRGNHSQRIIRNSNERKYYAVKGHPKYNSGKKEATGIIINSDPVTFQIKGNGRIFAVISFIKNNRHPSAILAIWFNPFTFAAKVL